MAKRIGRTAVEDFTEIKQFASSNEIALALRKLQRCLTEVRALRRESVHFDHERVRNAQFNIRVAILETFGSNSPEFGEYREYLIYSRTPRSVPTAGFETFRNVNQSRFIRELPQSESMLTGLITRLNEKRTEFLLRPEPQARVAFENLRLHPLIANSCAALYRDSHYRQAILDGSIALVNLVKNKSGRSNLDGADLMRKVFSRKNPTLAFTALRDRADEDEQEGMMHLFEGAVLALRNPPAHKLADLSAELALDYIAFLSLLANRVDSAKRRE
jgi:uncharacterized protein (TIGR02391 family)